MLIVANKIFLSRERQTFFSKNCKFQITIFRLLHSPLHFVHVVSSYAALIKTPKGVKYSSNPRLCQHCLIACLSLRKAGILSIFKSVISCNTLKKLHLILCNIKVNITVALFTTRLRAKPIIVTDSEIQSADRRKALIKRRMFVVQVVKCSYAQSI